MMIGGTAIVSHSLTYSIPQGQLHEGRNNEEQGTLHASKMWNFWFPLVVVLKTLHWQTVKDGMKSLQPFLFITITLTVYNLAERFNQFVSCSF